MLDHIVPADHILLAQDLPAKQDVIWAIGEVMLASGEVTPRYVRGMFQKEMIHGTWITEGVALPHGTNEVKSEVLRNTLVVVQLPKGVDWGKGKMVYLAIGFAGRGDAEHMKLLAFLASILQHKELVDRLARAQDKNEVIHLLTHQENPEQEGKAI